MSLLPNRDQGNLSPTNRFVSQQSPGETNPPGGLPRLGGRLPNSSRAFESIEQEQYSMLS